MPIEPVASERFPVIRRQYHVSISKGINKPSNLFENTSEGVDMIKPDHISTELTSLHKVENGGIVLALLGRGLLVSSQQ
jgi:hypothetical protein